MVKKNLYSHVKSELYHSKIADEITKSEERAKARITQQKLGIAVDPLPRRDRRAAQQQPQAQKKQSQRQNIQPSSTTSRTYATPKTELHHKQKINTPKKTKRNGYTGSEMKGTKMPFGVSPITFMLALQLTGTFLPAVAAMNTPSSFSNRNGRSNASKFRAPSHVNTTTVRMTPTPVFDVANIDSSNGYKLLPQMNFTGNLPGRAGQSVATVPSNTGYDNILVGSPGSKVGTMGRVDMIYGTHQTQANIPLYDHDDNTGVTFSSGALGIGENIRNIGDFDGDGNPDFLVTGKPCPNPIRIVYGEENGYPSKVNLDNMPSTQGFSVMQTDPRDNSLVSLETSAGGIGDINNDEKTDLIFPGCADPGDRRGVHGTNTNYCIVYGSAEYRENNISTIDLSELPYDGKQGTLIRPLVKNQKSLGPLTTVAPLGKVTDNGIDAFGIGYPGAFVGDYSSTQLPEGQVFVFAGQEGGLPGTITDPIQYLKEGGGVIFEGAKPGDRTGKGLTGGGDFGLDFNQDGHRDIAIGIPQQIYETGQVQVIYGPLTAERFPGRQISLGDLLPSQGTTLGGECASDGTGFALAPAGNFFEKDNHGGLVIATETGNKIFIVASRPNPGENIPLYSLAPEEGIKIINSQGSRTFGSAVAIGYLGNNNGTSVVIGDPNSLDQLGIPYPNGEVTVVYSGVEGTQSSSTKCQPPLSKPANGVKRQDNYCFSTPAPAPTFFGPAPVPHKIPAPHSGPKEESHLHWRIIAGAVGGSFLTIAFLYYTFVCCAEKKYDEVPSGTSTTRPRSRMN